MDLTITPKSLLLLLAAWTLSLSAAAQWLWIDKDGRKVFSDRPPTADIKEKDILKQPGRGRTAVAAPAEAIESGAATGVVPTASASSAPKANAPKLSGKDTELQARKKKLDQQEAEKKKADEEKVTSAKAENCGRAKKGLSSFQSGVRISTMNAKGERETMDDNARAAETKRLQTIIDSDCKSL
jgi:hypothetical protein